MGLNHWAKGSVIIPILFLDILFGNAIIEEKNIGVMVNEK